MRLLRQQARPRLASSGSEVVRVSAAIAGFTPGARVSEFADREARAVDVLSRPEWASEVSHEDLRRDQFLLEANGTATVIDWSFVTRTPRIVDAVSLGVGVGVAGLDAEMVLNARGPFPGYNRTTSMPCWQR